MPIGRYGTTGAALEHVYQEQSALEQLREHTVDASLELARPGGQFAQLEVRGGELLVEDLIVEAFDLRAYVATWIEAPALRFDLGERGDATEPVTSAYLASGKRVLSSAFSPAANSGASLCRASRCCRGTRATQKSAHLVSGLILARTNDG